MQQSPGQSRRALMTRLFPEGITSLWCPPITHYTESGGIDRARCAAHLNSIAPYVKGLLAAGSTGDGWLLSNEQAQGVINAALESATKHRQRVLVGVLKTDYTTQTEALREMCKWLSGTTSAAAVNRLTARNICGFTVCPPKGEELAGPELEFALASYLDLGLPLALYQLPQATLNEVPPEVVYGLLMKYSNLVLFKDSSGTDAVAQYRKKRGDLFLLRGAEGQYARWFAAGGGPYHGFLLSTANCFARELRQVLEDLRAGRTAEAQKLSDRLTAVVTDLFAAVKPVREGNPFANANKATDHFFAFGPKAASVAPPRLHSGNLLPAEVIQAVGEILTRHSFLPERGYLE